MVDPLHGDRESRGLFHPGYFSQYLGLAHFAVNEGTVNHEQHADERILSGVEGCCHLECWHPLLSLILC